MAKVKLGNVKGSKGDKGDRGSLWRVSDKMTGQSTSGTAFPGAGFEDSVVNDICLNPATFDLYRCQTAGNAAAAKWVWECNIKGAPGPKGDNGDPTTVDAVLSESSANPIQNKAVAVKFKDVQDSLGHAGRLFSGDLGRLSIDGAGHIKLWTNAEFKEKFGAEPMDCFIAVSNRASGSSGIFLASPRWNGEAVFTTQMSVQDGVVKAVPGVSQAATPVAYFVAVYQSGALP